jgi:hypothetical protein
MPKVLLPNYKPELEPEAVGRVLEQQLGGKYEIEPMPDARFVDFKVYPSEWKGAMVRLKQDQKGERTMILVNGRVPHIWARLALVIIVWFPLVYADLVASRPVVDDVMNALQSSPELTGAEAATPPPPPPPPPAPGPTA